MRRTDISTMRRASELRANLTEAETRLWQVIRRGQIKGIHFRRQHAISPYIVDFCSPHWKLIIEVDGSQHQDQREYDEERTVYLESRGFRVLRFCNGAILRDLESAVNEILDALGE